MTNTITINGTQITVNDAQTHYHNTDGKRFGRSAIAALQAQEDRVLEYVANPDVFTAHNLQQVITSLLATGAATKWLAPESKMHAAPKAMMSAFLANKLNNTAILADLNKLSTDGEEYLSSIIGKLDKKLSLPKLNLGASDYELAKVTLAGTVLKVLCELQLIDYRKENIKEINEDTGKVTWKVRELVRFGTPPEVDPMFIKGVHAEPGVVLQKQTKVQVGGKANKLTGKEKLFLKSAASLPLRLVQTTTREWFIKYLHQTEWAMAVKAPQEGKHKSKEDPILMAARIETIVDHIMVVQAMPTVYLSMWMDYRTRLYYDLTLAGINPQGKTGEYGQWEAATAELITNPHPYYYSAVVLVEDKRFTHAQASTMFLANPDYYLDKLSATTDDMDQDFYNQRLAQAIRDFDSATPSHFLLGEDVTNGGLQNGGAGFKSSTMLEWANMGGLDEVLDSHQHVADTFGLTRKEAKDDIQQGLLHGQAIATIAKNIGMSPKEATDFIVKTYGREVLSINQFAKWCSDIVTNDDTTLLFTTLDGFKAQSTSYVESVPLKLYLLSTTESVGYSQTTVHKDMPIKLTRKGDLIYGSVTIDGKTNKSMGGKVKLMGGFANVTHSADATALRAIVRMLAQSGRASLFKHDNFFAHGNYMEDIRASYKAKFLELFDYSVYESAAAEMAHNHSQSVPLPELIIGNADRSIIEKSQYFLSA